MQSETTDSVKKLAGKPETYTNLHLQTRITGVKGAPRFLLFVLRVSVIRVFQLILKYLEENTEFEQVAVRKVLECLFQLNGEQSGTCFGNQSIIMLWSPKASQDLLLAFRCSVSRLFFKFQFLVVQVFLLHVLVSLSSLISAVSSCHESKQRNKQKIK